MQKVVLDKYNTCDYNQKISKAQALDHMVRRPFVISNKYCKGNVLWISK